MGKRGLHLGTRVNVTSASRREVNEERRRWLFPPVTGSFDGIELADLNPTNPDDRQVLIMAEHADLYRAIKRLQDEVEIGESRINARLHVAMHEIVARQLRSGKPTDAWPTVERLRGLGYGRHNIIHMLGSIISEQVWKPFRKGEVHDPERYPRALAALPASWFAQG